MPATPTDDDPLHDPLLVAVPELEGFKVLGRVVLLRKIGSGGMGVVYSGYHLGFGELFAVKVLKPRGREDTEYLKRFHQEARAAVRVTHPNVVRVNDVDEAHGLHFLVMELVDGESVTTRMQRWRRMRQREAVTMLLGVAAGLGEVHRQNLVHRDVKPDNLLIQHNGRVKLADLGIVRVSNSDGSGVSTTQFGGIAGTPQYMPPEQWQSPLVRPSCDVWALGATFHYLLTGETAIATRPFDQMKKWVEANPLPSLRHLDLAPAVHEIYERCGQIDPAARFQDGGEVYAALHALGLHDEELLRGESFQVSPPRTPAAFGLDEARIERIRQRIQRGSVGDLPGRTVPMPSPSPDTLVLDGQANRGRATAVPTPGVGKADLRAHARRTGSSSLWLGPALAVIIGGGVFAARQLGQRGPAEPVATPPPTQADNTRDANPDAAAAAEATAAAAARQREAAFAEFLAGVDAAITTDPELRPGTAPRRKLREVKLRINADVDGLRQLVGVLQPTGPDRSDAAFPTTGTTPFVVDGSRSESPRPLSTPEDGEHRLRLLATDATGRSGELPPRSVCFDTAPPTTPRWSDGTAPSVVRTGDVLRLVTTERGGGTATLLARVGADAGTEQAVGKNGEVYEWRVELPEGEHTVRFVARDDVGNESLALEATIKVDATPPPPPNLAPRWFTQATSLVLQGRADGAAVVELRSSGDTTTTKVRAGVFQQDVTCRSDVTTWTLTAIDAAGLRSEPVTTTVVRSPAPPTFSWLGPDVGSELPGPNALVEFEVKPAAVAGIEVPVKVTIDGKNVPPLPSDPTRYRSEQPVSKAGSQLTIVVRDEAAHEVTRPVTLGAAFSPGNRIGTAGLRFAGLDPTPFTPRPGTPAVQLPAPVAIATTEVTHGQWRQVMADTADAGLATLDDDLPIAVDPVQAQRFCERLTRLERAQGRLGGSFGYDLPDENEWLCALRSPLATAGREAFRPARLQAAPKRSPDDFTIDHLLGNLAEHCRAAAANGSGWITLGGHYENTASQDQKDQGYRRDVQGGGKLVGFRPVLRSTR